MARIDSNNFGLTACGGMYIMAKGSAEILLFELIGQGRVGVSTAQAGWFFSSILDWAFVKFFFVFIHFFPICLFWGRYAGTNDDRVVGFRRRMVFFQLPSVSFLHSSTVWLFFLFSLLILPVVLTPENALCCCFFHFS